MEYREEWPLQEAFRGWIQGPADGDAVGSFLIAWYVTLSAVRFYNLDSVAFVSTMLGLFEGESARQIFTNIVALQSRLDRRHVKVICNSNG